MRSKRPKVLHPLAGRPLIDYTVELAQSLGIDRPIVVLNPHQAEVAAHLEGRADVVYQREQRGTGHAVMQVPADRLRGRRVLVLNADQPLVSPELAKEVIEAQQGVAAALVAVTDPSRRDGRILRGPDGGFAGIVEHKDATPEQRRIAEQNAGIYCFDGAALLEALPKLTADNAAGELYLTDALALLGPVAVVAGDPEGSLGINDRTQLARAEAVLKRREVERQMLNGVTFTAPETCFVDAGVLIGQDTVIEPFTILRAGTKIGADCVIGPYADIGDSEIGDACRVDRSWLRGSKLANGSDCGPFSKLRPGTEIGERVHVGSFAELVRSRVGADSAVPHFSYVGDAVIGERVNIAAGTITANYDGEKKNPTVIEDDVFVGVDTMLRAPVRLGRGSRTGAGSVVTKDVPEGATAVGMPARVVKRKPKEEDA